MTMRWMAAALLAAVLLLAAGQGRCSAAAADENAQEVSVVVVNHQGSDHKDSFPWTLGKPNLKRITATTHNALLVLGGLYIRIGLGTPVQITHLALDSVSNAPTWVVGADSPVAKCSQSTKMPFDASKSSSLSTNHTEMTVNTTFGGPAQADFSAGYLAKDTLHFGHFKSQQQAFVIAEAVSNIDCFCSSVSSGSIPLSPDLSVAPGINSPLVDMAMRLDHKVIGLYCPALSDGELTIGATNKSEAKGGLLSFPQLSVPGTVLPWLLSFDSISFGNITLSSTSIAVISTSSPILVAPVDAFMKIYNSLNIYNLTDTAQQYGVSCSAVKSSPPLVFNIGGKSLTLDPSFWIVQINTFCTLAILPNDANTMASKYGHLNLGIDSAEGDPDLWLLGTRFLASFYTEYHYSPTDNSTLIKVAETPMPPVFHCIYHVWCLGDYGNARKENTYRCTDFFGLGLNGTGISMTIYDPCLIPISTAAALVGFLTFWYILKHVSASTPNRLQYMVCFLFFGCMNTAGTLLHCFTNEEIKLIKHQLGFYMAYFDDVFTTFTDMSYAFCGFFDIALVLAGLFGSSSRGQSSLNNEEDQKKPLLPKSETRADDKSASSESTKPSSALRQSPILNHPIVLTVYIGAYVYVFYVWTHAYFVLEVDHNIDEINAVNDLYYTDFNSKCPLIFLACQIVYMLYTKASWKSILWLGSSAVVGFVGLKLEQTPKIWRDVCNVFDAYVGLEEFWYFCSGTSIFLLGKYFLTSHRAPSQKTTSLEYDPPLKKI